MVGSGALGFGGTDWKACIGSASKNSWATMNGVLSAPKGGGLLGDHSSRQFAQTYWKVRIACSLSIL